MVPIEFVVTLASRKLGVDPNRSLSVVLQTRRLDCKGCAAACLGCLRHYIAVRLIVDRVGSKRESNECHGY